MYLHSMHISIESQIVCAKARKKAGYCLGPLSECLQSQSDCNAHLMTKQNNDHDYEKANT